MVDGLLLGAGREAVGRQRVAPRARCHVSRRPVEALFDAGDGTDPAYPAGRQCMARGALPHVANQYRGTTLILYIIMY